METHHRGVFTWPSQAWTHRERDRNVQGQGLLPGDLGIDLDAGSHQSVVQRRVNEAMEQGQEDPLVVCDMTSVVTKYRHIRRCFPRIRPYFAVKAHDDPAIISLLDHLGAGFDCASKNEIDMLVRKLNVDPGNIIFANAVKMPSHLQFAANNGVTMTTFDCEEELHKIKDIQPNVRLVLRLSPVETNNVSWPLSKKFGCAQSNVRCLFKKAKSLHLNVMGICFHAGSGIDDADVYVRNIQAAKVAWDAGLEEGCQLHLLDIGGGFYGDTGGEDKLEKMSLAIKVALDKHFPADSGVKLIAEPGRYFVESGLIMAACVIGKKKAEVDTAGDKEDKSSIINSEGMTSKSHDKDNNLEAKFSYYISSSIFGILNCNLYYSNFYYNPTPIRRKEEKRESHMSVIWGPSCDSIDKIQKNTKMEELDIGDWLVFRDVGAYTISVGCTFNGFVMCSSVHRVIHPDVWRQVAEKPAAIVH